MLSAGTGGTENFHLHIGRVNFHLYIFHFRHNGHGRGGGMNSSAALRFRNSLHAVYTGLVFESRVCPLSVYDKYHFLQTAESRFIEGNELRFPASLFRITRIHSV